MRILIVLIGFVFLFFSCKKDKLEDGKEIFIGTWNWIYTDHEYYICIGMPQEEVLTPETEHRNYSMEFFEKGIVKFYENDNLISRDRLIFAQYGNVSGFGAAYTSFDIYLNKYNYDKDNYIQGAVSSDTLIFKRLFPFKNNDCSKYISYFVKE